jgi:hypothetical protein
VNVDLFGNTTAGTSKCRCQTKCRLRMRRAPDATNCASCKTDGGDTRPSCCFDNPNDRSDTAPNPTVHIQPTSSHKVDTRPNGHNDTEPSR